MGKERLTAFFDAVLAIIITILVLELPKPAEPTWGAFTGLYREYFAFTLSFFWLGSLWIHQHDMWHHIKHIDAAVVRISMLTLFFAAWFPYTTSWVNEEFYATVPQALYGLVAILVTISTIALNRSLVKANPDNLEFEHLTNSRNGWLAADLLIKAAGFALSFIYPPAAMLGILIAAAFINVAPRVRRQR